MDFKVYHNDRPTTPQPPLPPWMKKGLWIVGVLIVLFVLLHLTMGLVADYVWMDSLGFGQVFTTLMFTRVLLFAIGFALYGGALFLVLLGIRKVYLRSFALESVPVVFQKGKLYVWISLGIAVLFGLLGSAVVQGLGWERFLTFFNQESFGTFDPIFGKDTAFYVYSLPFINFVLNTLTSLLVILLIIQGLAYSVFQLYLRNRRAQWHILINIVTLGAVLMVRHFLARYDTLLTDQVNLFQRSSVFGVSYTDVLINIPFTYVLMATTAVAVILLLIGLFKQRIYILLLAPIVYVGMLVIGQGASFVVQNFVVSPSEFSREQPYLPHNIDLTQRAYGLDNVTIDQHPGNGPLSRELLERNELTINNLRVNDARPLRTVYNQQQTFRTYYQFNDIDVDRYMIDGEYQQVFIGARELNTAALPGSAQNWESQKLRYTHSYGVSMNRANDIDAQGQPVYILKNLPPEGALDVTRPQIYFGEQPYQTVIGNTHTDEVSYPNEEGINVSYQYTGQRGIPMTMGNRLLFSWEERSPRIAFSAEVHEESQLLRVRNIHDRVQEIAPFLEYDSDPYIVVREDGTLIWIIDAYTFTDQYPYSEPVRRGMNYVRNPVKAVVDAYTGEVFFYVVDEDDPLIRTYQNIFPELFTTDIPEDIRAQFRYPINLFNYQVSIYRTYHMSDLGAFYNREDFWQFASERYYGQDVQVEPYYITMQLPGEDQEEFILMQTFTPNNRHNMIAWMGARNDGEHYGELVLYQFPRQRTVYGPRQIENRINQDPWISQQLNLWDQAGSRVLRGNLLVIPIEDTILYIEPIYIESEGQTSFPEVKQIVVAYDDYIVMDANFDRAITKLLEMIEQGVDPGEVPDGEGGITETAEDMLQELAGLFDSYQNALGAGQWEQAGRILSELQRKLEAWNLEHLPEGIEGDEQEDTESADEDDSSANE